MILDGKLDPLVLLERAARTIQASLPISLPRSASWFPRVLKNPIQQRPRPVQLRYAQSAKPMQLVIARGDVAARVLLERWHQDKTAPRPQPIPPEGVSIDMKVSEAIMNRGSTGPVLGIEHTPREEATTLTNSEDIVWAPLAADAAESYGC